MHASLAAPLVLAALLGAATVSNEWSHGAMSEAMGFGHHHLLDAGGYHCVSHDDAALGAAHVAHMHGNASAGAVHPHMNCPGGAGMHGGHDHGAHVHAIPPEPEGLP